jgi:hypothetical protein
VASLEGKHLVVFYYFSKSEIWSEKRGGLWWEGACKRGATVFTVGLIVFKLYRY